MAATIQHIELPKKPRALDSSTSVQEVSQELVTNGSMEADANWSNQSSPTTNERSSAQANGGTYSRKVVGNSSGDGIKSDTFSLVEGRTYRVEFYYYLTTGSNNLLARLQDGDGGDLGSSEVFGTKDTWTKITFTRVAESTGDASYFKIYQNQVGTSTFYVDDVSVKEIDTFSNNNHGKIYSGRALEFDGVADCLEGVANINASYGITDDITVACWIKFNAIGVLQRPWNIYEGTDDGFGLALTAGGYLEVIEDIGGGDVQLYPEKINIDTWYRAVVVVDSLEIKFYINGVLLGSGTSIVGDGFDSFASKLYIGRRGHTTEVEYFNGCMSDFQMWDTAWSADDVTYDYANPESLALNASGTALTESNLKLWYPMQDGHRGQQSYILDGANTGLVSYVVNEDFSTGTSGYTVSTSPDRGAITNPDGILRLTYGASYSGGNALLGPSLLVIGTTYKVKFRAKGTQATDFGSVGNNANVQVSEITNPVLTTDWQDYEFLVTANSANLRFYQGTYGSGGTTLDIDDVTVQPINDKHHATTVFYGDEQISNVEDRTFASSIGNWTNAGGSNALDTFSRDASSQSLHVAVSSDGSNVKYASLDEANWADADGDGPAMVEGRSYRLSFDLAMVISGGTLGVGLANDSFSMSSAVVSLTSVASSNVIAYSVDFVYNATDHKKIMIHAATSTIVNISLFDNFSLKEVGVASGWTDADQQLDIAQPALQSYNEMGMFLGVDDGTDSDVSCGSDASIDNVFDSGGTFSTWIYPIGIGAADYGRIFDKNYIYFYLQSESGDTAQLAFTGITSGAPNTVARSTNRDINYGQWQHVVITYNADSPGTAPVMYINGVAIGVTCPAGVGTRISDANDSLHLGNSASGNKTFNGCITEASFWEEILTAAEVLELYNEGKALDATTHSQADELKAYWRNNGLSTWTDLSTNTNTGTVNNITETLLIPQGVDGSRDAQGFIMNKTRNTSCLNLDGVVYGQVGNFEDSFDFGTTAFTVQAWVKPRSLAADDRIVTKGTTDAAEWMISIGVDNASVRVFAKDSGGASVDTGSTFSTLSVDTWAMITVVIDTPNDQILFYKDDGSVETKSFSGWSGNFNGSAPLRIGANESLGTARFDGQVDGLLVFDKALSATEKTRNYKATKGSHRN